MLVYLIFTFCNLLTLALVFGFYHGCAKPNGQMLLTVTLSKCFFNDKDVEQITTEYKRKCTNSFFVLLLVALSFYFLRNYMSISVLLMLLYCFLIYAVYSILLEHYRKKLLALKKERNWTINKTHILNIDTEVTRLKNTFPVSRKHFIPPIVISALTCLTCLLSEENLSSSSIIIASCVASVILCGVVLYEIFARLPSRVYCENSEANIALNRSYKHECSKMCVGIMYSGVAMLPMVITPQSSGNFLFSVLFSTTLSTVICLATILKAFFKIRHERNNFITLIEKNIEIDDDEYWHYGFYYNPNDNKTFVESRVGFGLELNYSKTSSKIMLSITAVILAGVLWLFITLLPMDFIESFELQQNNDTFMINAPAYSVEFAKDDIASVTKQTEIKSYSRTNGAATSKYLLGNFNVSGYGDVKMYVLNDVELYVSIKLKNGTYIFINGADVSETEKFYKMLTE